MPYGHVVVTLLLFTFSLATDDAPELSRPVQIQCQGKPLDVQREGHAAPFLGDFFEDGTMALLVGQYDEGRLRIYRNTGTRTRPKFDSFTWFEADGKLARVPEG
ncbi:MAG TPA: hypothetical protein VK395_14485 [Gemmataceae bacterium]|nr:hypothetical protein [Gemmataceae bacterium]